MSEQAHRDETTTDKTTRIDGRTRRYMHPDYVRPIDHESDVARRASHVCYTPSSIPWSSSTSLTSAGREIIYGDVKRVPTELVPFTIFLFLLPLPERKLSFVTI